VTGNPTSAKDTNRHSSPDTGGESPRHPDGGHEGGHDGGGHDGGHHEDHATMFRRLFWISLVLAVPVVVLSPTVQDWFGYTLEFTGSDWIPPILGTVIFAVGGRPFLTGAIDEIRDHRPGMMLLIGLAITTAFAASALSAFGLFDLEFWWELATLIVVMLLGHWQEMRAVGRARSALASLAELLPDTAERVRDDGEIEEVAPAQLEPGDVIIVRPGARVPADGTIVEGAASFDESMLTGESRPVGRGEDDRVAAGSVATDSSVRVEVTAVGDDTALGGIRRLVEEAQQSTSHTQALADRAAAWLFYIAVSAGAATFVTWLLIAGADPAFVRTIGVLVIACPHALGLAIPLVISISTGIAAQRGILVRDRLAVEQMRSIDVVLFDKTGTLTTAEHRVTGVVAENGDGDRIVTLAAAAERDSEHPLARAIREEASGLDVPESTSVESRPGRGVRAEVAGSTVEVGGPAILEAADARPPRRGPTAESEEEWQARGAAVVFVLVDGEVAGAIALEDEIRPESHEAVEALHERGVDVALITGDARAVADHVASQLGIDQVFAEVLPEDKDAEVGELQERGRKVAMVGDGVNDAPALARADVGIAIGAGTDVAIESAGIILASDDPRAVLDVFQLSKAGRRKMIQNLAWAAGYNVLAIPLAAGVLAWAGFTLQPAVGAALMSLSTVIVAINAQFLRTMDFITGPE
jgi:Cu2+-exporting ATPase